MADLGQAYVQIMPSAEGISGKIQKALAPEMSASGTSAGSLLSSKIKGAIKVAGIGTAITMAVKEGANLEQSIGGIETLFKDDADAVIKNAEKAYKTAGVSANQYMEQATSFSASLLQSLDGDTKKAGEITNQAIIDMADNANKMGTPLESIQTAYQGFAKGQYMLLDNLKLGYGGTKTEMQRLLSDAEKISGQKYDINNLADVYNAIHLIQGELGITGTTAKEGATTLSGSFMAMKSALQNVMGALITGKGLKGAISGLIDSAITFAGDNLVPALSRLVENLPTLIGMLLQKGVPKLGAMILRLVPQILLSLSKAMTSLANYINRWLDNFATNGGLSSRGKKVISAFAQGLIRAIPQIVLAMGRLAGALFRAVASLPGKMLRAGIDAIKGFISGIKNMKMPKLHIVWSTEARQGPGGMIVKVPKPSLKWYKTGGIFSNPSVIGVGEAGAEAVVPLDKLWSKMDAMANTGGGTLRLTVNVGDDTLYEKTINYINGQTMMFGSSPLTI